MRSSFYKEFFPRAAEHIVLSDADAKDFELFATEVHEYGFDWWFADDTACWGRRAPSERSASIRLGRLDISRTGAYVTVSVKTNGKEVLQRDHGALLETLGTLQNDKRYIIPIKRAIDLIRNEEFVLSLIALTPARDGCEALWEADYDERHQHEATNDSLALTRQLVQRASEIGCPPGSSVQRMVFVRKGHQAFRKGVVKHWKEQCAVLGPIDKRLLVASHIVPWSEADEREKTDPNNGLLLSSPLDALFDLGLISFSDVGAMLIRDVDVSTLRAFGLAGGVFGLREPERLLTEEMRNYLRRHRRSHGFPTN